LINVIYALEYCIYSQVSNKPAGIQILSWYQISFNPKSLTTTSTPLFFFRCIFFLMVDQPKFHPALTITNVKSLIPITLDAEHGMYHSWAALFTILVRVHDLHHHIISPTEANEVASYAASKAADPTLWKRLDAAVLQWIYGTISTDLLHAILLKDDTAQGAWARLESMFQDNKVSRATHLEEELADLNFENFSSIDSYCNHIKSLVDRLADVDAPLTNSRLVLKLTVGLPEAYAGIVDIIQNQEPLPLFASSRS